MRYLGSVLAGLALALILWFTPAYAQDPNPPAPNLTLRLDDNGDGTARYKWIDNDGRVYDLGPLISLAPVIESAGDVESMIEAAARKHRVDARRMKRIAWCESKYQARATSRGGHRGIFQWDAQSWRERAPLAGVSADFSVAYDPRANVEVSADTMADGQWGRWQCQ